MNDIELISGKPPDVLKQGEPGLMGEVGPAGLAGFKVSFFTRIRSIRVLFELAFTEQIIADFYCLSD